MKAATDELRAAGITNADKLARLCAATVIERSLACWRARPDASRGVLAQMVLQGGPSERDKAPRRFSRREQVLGDRDSWVPGYREGVR